MASFSISLGGGPKNRKSSPPLPKSGIKRAHAVLDDADSEDEDANAGKRQNITHFDLSAGGAVDTSKPKVVKEALVIKPQANRDWKEASARNKRKKYGLPSEDQQKERENFIPPEAATSYGLNVFKTDAIKESAAQDEAQIDSVENAPAEAALTKPKTDDERAIAALMGFKEESTRTIPALTEEEALQRDTNEAPDAPTLEEYAAVPVEEFGAAMLRGMGWKEGQGIGTQKGQKTVKAKVPDRRPALLGIGAKPDAAVAAELGAWGAGAKGRKRVDIVYNPLVLKNAKTGEQLTEEELKAKMQDQKEREVNERYVHDSGREKPSRRHRHDEQDLDEKEDRHRRERRREKDYEDDRRSSRRERDTSTDKYRSRRDRSPSYDRPREKRRDRDYDERREKRRDGDYDERKEKDRRRRDRDDHHDRERRDRDRYDDDRDRRHRR